MTALGNNQVIQYCNYLSFPNQITQKRLFKFIHFLLRLWKKFFKDIVIHFRSDLCKKLNPQQVQLKNVYRNSRTLDL